MGIFDKVAKSVSGVAVSAGTSVTRSAALKKTEMELSDLNNKYDECYLIIGKRIAEFMRNGEDIDDARVVEAFNRISKFDTRKSELEDEIREINGEKGLATEAKKLAEVEAEVEKEISKCKELLEMGVDSQDDYDRKVAVFRNKVEHFKQLGALDTALSKKLISKDEYQTKKAAILGKDVVT
ncbi:hypothetical protein KAI46_08415 [bacterium]|nr:hypothetical protein [bacterium]